MAKIRIPEALLAEIEKHGGKLPVMNGRVTLTESGLEFPEESDRMEDKDLIRYFPDISQGGRMKGGRTMFQANCPCHPNKVRSLLLYASHDEKGRITELQLRCQAGCSVVAIMDVAGLLEPERPQPDAPAERPGGEDAVMTRAELERRAQMAMIHQQEQTGQHLGNMVRIYQEMDRRLEMMADLLRVTNERMAAMEKVTPQQASRINACIRDRARDLCEEYRIGKEERKKEMAVRAAIRKGLAEMTGARNVREIARCDAENVVDFILGWEDYEILQQIRKRKPEP